ncbi:MAG: fibronectin type III domain-containing protein, partial [Flavobacteriia bacterium]
SLKVKLGHYGTNGSVNYYHDNVIVKGVSTCTPTSSPSSLTFSNVASQSLSLSWTAGNGNRTLVVASPSALSANPTSGITYTANSNYGSGSLIGNGYVVFDGLSSVTSTAVVGLNRNTNYFFTVFTYNSSGNCYREPGVSSSQTTANLPIALYVDNNSNTGDVFTQGSSSGSNSANGKKLTPFATLTYAVSQAIPGDTIYVDAGTYTTDIAILLNNSKQGISIIGAGIGLTYFDRLSSSAVNTDWFMHINTSNITLKDFTIQGYENQGNQTTAYESGQAITIGGDATLDNNILIQNVMFNQNGEAGGNASIDILSNSNVTLLGGGSSCNLWQTM